MKKKLIIIISLVLIIIVGIVGIWYFQKNKNKDIDNNNQTISDAKRKELNERLIEFGREQFDEEHWTNGGIQPLTYYLTLTQLKDFYDISDFKGCNEDLTMIQFVVSEETEKGKTNYEFKPVLECD